VLAAIGAAALTAWATEDWWVLPLGLATGATLLFWVPEPTARLPQRLDALHRATGRRLITLQRRLQEVLADLPLEARRPFGLSAARLVAVANELLALVEFHQQLEEGQRELALLSGVAAQREGLDRAAAQVASALGAVEARLEEAVGRVVAARALAPAQRARCLPEALLAASCALDDIAELAARNFQEGETNDEPA
jgi:hypothetical protein